MPTPLSSSLRASKPSDRRLLAHELYLAAVREQAAIVRAFLDEVERIAPSSATQDAAAKQVVEELAELGHRILAATAVMARALEAQPAHSPTAV